MTKIYDISEAINPNFPAVILVAPQMSQNIGAVARAMLNFGLTDLRLVTPQADWRNKDAYALAAGAAPVLERTRVYESLPDALKDRTLTIAATARSRDVVKDVYTPDNFMEKVLSMEVLPQLGLVFGREKSGLSNEEVSFCDAIVSYPILPDFASLNLAQAVVVMAYQWRASMVADEHKGVQRPLGRTGLAEKASVHNFFDHLEKELEVSGFLRVPHKKALMLQNIRAIFARAELTEQEVQTLHGIVSFLAKMDPEGRVRRSHRQQQDQSQN